MWQTWVWSLGREDPLEKGMATHYSILAWRIPWTEEPGGVQSMGSHRVGHNRAANTNTIPVYTYWSKAAQSCPTLCNHRDCSLPGSSIHGIFQARVLEWVAISFSLESLNLEHWKQHMLAGMWSKRNAHTLLVRMQKWSSSSGRQFGDLWLNKHILTIRSRDYSPPYVPVRVHKTYKSIFTAGLFIIVQTWKQ